MSQTTLLDQILSGQSRDLQMMAASGLVPLPLDELIPLQVGLTASPDTEISSKASEALQNLEPRLTAEYLTDAASEAVLTYFARNVRHPTMVGAILRRQTTPHHLMVEMAPHLPPDLQETLILRQDAIIEEPQILVALESNPEITNYAKRRVWEYREHLLPRDKVPHKTEAEIEAEAEKITQEEVQEAVEEVTGEPAKIDPDGEIDLKKLTAEQVRFLPVPMRVKVANGASRELRSMLIRDTNSQVALAVLTRNAIPDTEVEQIANNRQVCEEVLAEIAKKREWIRKYPIQKALVKNPKTYTSLAVKFVPRMMVRDLRDLAKDKNVSDAVRSLALRIYNARKSS